MPELPEVETICRALSGSINGQRIKNVELRRKNLRVPFSADFIANISGKRIMSISRRAKYLIFALDNGMSIIAHLGMSGSFTVRACSESFQGDAKMSVFENRNANVHDSTCVAEAQKNDICSQPSKDYEQALSKARASEKHDHVIFTFEDGRTLIYNDPRRFGLMIVVKSDDLIKHPLLADLGPEPFSESFNAAYLKKQLAKRKIPLKPALMEQKLVVGVGNIYASEALFLAGIDPRKPSMEASANVSDIIKRIREVLNAAIDSGGSSLRDFVHISGDTGNFQHNFKVYGRSGKSCHSCKTTIQTIRQAGRATFFCPSCQK